MLYLRTATEVQQAADAIFDRVKMARRRLDPRTAGAKHGSPRGRPELRVVVEHDPVFGPLIMLGKAALSGVQRNRPRWRYRR